jgi:hypothetical protein
MAGNAPLITQALGGRSAKAAMWLQGRTDFNSELFGGGAKD